MIGLVISSCSDQQRPSIERAGGNTSRKEPNDSQASGGKQGKHESRDNGSKGSAKEGSDEAEQEETLGNSGQDGCTGSEPSSTTLAPGAAKADPCDTRTGRDDDQQGSDDDTPRDDDTSPPDAKDPAGEPPPASSVTFAQVEPIAEKSCSGFFCHRTYTQEATWRVEKDAIQSEIESGSMPRGGTLSPSDKQLVLTYLKTL
jgi:hypothetical protein